jgi:hypothetical protein
VAIASDTRDANDLSAAISPYLGPVHVTVARLGHD